MAAKKKSTAKPNGKAAAKSVTSPTFIAPEGAPVYSSTSELSEGTVTATATSVIDRSHEDKMRDLNALRQKHPDRFVRLEDLSTPYFIRRPTGVIALDIALAGGFPAGGASMISGPYSTGKSYLMWRTFAMGQRIYGGKFIGGLVHVEGAMDFEGARKCGCYIALPDSLINQMNEQRWRTGRPTFTGEHLDWLKAKVGHIETVQGITGEELLQGVLDLNEKAICHLIGIDSVSALLPKADADKDLDDETKRAAHATMMKQFWLHYMPTVRRGTNYTTIIALQQATTDQDRANKPSYIAQYLPEWIIKSSKATEHNKLVDVVLKSGALDKDDKTKVVKSKSIHFQTAKGKAGTHDHVHGDMQFYYIDDDTRKRMDVFDTVWYGPDIYGDLVVAGLQSAIVRSDGNNKWLVLNPATNEPLDDVRYTSYDEIKHRLYVDVNYELMYRDAILTAHGIRCSYR